jgi:hypothetical protein
MGKLKSSLLSYCFVLSPPWLSISRCRSRYEADISVVKIWSRPICGQGMKQTYLWSRYEADLSVVKVWSRPLCICGILYFKLNLSLKLILLITHLLCIAYGYYEIYLLSRGHILKFWFPPSSLRIEYIRVIAKLPNSKQSNKGKVKTHKNINRQNQSTTGKLWKPQWPWPGTGISKEMVG